MGVFWESWMVDGPIVEFVELKEIMIMSVVPQGEFF